jgi:monofunctional biosynthetic peptidoglycan transglycosylase
MRRRAAKIAIGLAAACFALLGYIFLTLPDVRPLATKNPPTTAFIELRRQEAREAGRAPRQVQRWVRYEAISPNLRKAVLVAEDDAFWTHDGVDVEQLKESIEKNLSTGRASRGGSTITQQLAKNLYLSPSKNPVRKLRELLIARRLEASLSKRRILELYLNVIEWGDGIYGAEAASRVYFGKPASLLSPDEAALLAGAIINPRVHSPAHPTARLRRRQQIILMRMGLVTPPEEAPDEPEPPPPPLPIDQLEPTPPVSPPDEPATPPERDPDAQPLPPSSPPEEKPPESVPPPAESAPSVVGVKFVIHKPHAPLVSPS